MENSKLDIIKVNNLSFEKYIDKEDIKKNIKLLAKSINIKFEHKDPVFLAVLDGSFMFTADLLKRVNIHSTLSFVKIKSYEGTESTGNHKELIGLDKDLTGKHIIILEDIIDTGLTMKYLINELNKINPASITITSLLIKRDALKFNVEPDFALFEIQNDFVVGYGLDFDGYGRNLKHIYKVCKPEPVIS